MPIATAVLGSNTDVTPVVKRKGQASVLYEVMDDMEKNDANAKEKIGDAYQKSKLGCKLHKAFMAEVGEQMCQAEIAHYANKSPEYLCSRPEKYVHIYKKALAISLSTQRQRQRAAAGDTNGQRKPSATGQGARNDTPGVTCGG